jgi:2,5-diketo-D-gluconate reductase A
MQTVTLNNGVEMPILGFGVFQVRPKDTERAVSEALAAGYRLIDTASAYQNEAQVGQAIRASGVPREDLFITTKLWVQDAGDELAKHAFETSLELLGLDYLDLWLIHQPLGDYYGAWRAMEALHGEGRVRAIGVSNFHADRLVDLIDHNDVTPAVNQIEMHPFYQRQADQDLMRERGVQAEAWGPLAQGRNNLFSDPVLSDVAGAHGKTIAQVVLRWLIQRQIVVIPRSVDPGRVRENFDLFDFALMDREMDRLAELDTGATVFADIRDPGLVAKIGTLRFDSQPTRA